MKIHRAKSSLLLAFTLLEVMIAVAIFFMATFSILALVSRCLAQARSLQPMQVDANMVVAELSLTNKLEEGPIPDDIIKRFQHLYPDYTCDGTITEVRTNGLFEIQVRVAGVTAGRHLLENKTTNLLFRPLSTAGRRFGPTPLR